MASSLMKSSFTIIFLKAKKSAIAGVSVGEAGKDERGGMEDG